MAIVNGASLVAWGPSTILAFLIVYHLSVAGVLTVSSEEEVDDSLPRSTNSGQAGPSGISVDLPDRSPPEEDYLISSVYRPATHVPRLHRKLNSFMNLQMSKKLSQSTTPLPQGPPISNEVHLQELSAVTSVNRFKKEPIFQELAQSSTPPPQGPSPVSNRVHPQDLSVDSSVNSYRKELNFQKLPHDTSPPLQGPSPISNRVHLHELSADSSINNYRRGQNFQKLTQTTTSPLQGPSPVSYRFHPHELSDDNLESQKHRFHTRGHHTPTWNRVKVFQDFRDDKSWQDHSNLPSSSIMLHDQQKNIMKSNVLIRARRHLRSMNFNVEAVSRNLGQVTQSPPEGPFPTPNRMHLQEIASLSAPSNSNAPLKPMPLPPLLTSPSGSPQREEKKSGGGRLVFQMLPQDTALAPSGPSPIHN